MTFVEFTGDLRPLMSLAVQAATGETPDPVWLNPTDEGIWLPQWRGTPVNLLVTRVGRHWCMTEHDPRNRLHPQRWRKVYPTATDLLRAASLSPPTSSR